MQKYTFVLLSFFILVTSILWTCNESSTASSQEEEVLQTLMRNFFEWHENESQPYDFPLLPNENETMFASVNQEVFDVRVDELVATEFFSQEFIDHFKAIADEIDAGLSDGTIVYQIGDMPPFGGDADPWCNCQDVPEGDYWEEIEVSIKEMDENKVTFTWTWGDPAWSEGFAYEVIAVKTEEGWKIADLEGFRDYL